MQSVDMFSFAVLSIIMVIQSIVLLNCYTEGQYGDFGYAECY